MHTSAPALAIILDTAVKSTVLLGFAWGAALALKKSSAATQHLVRTFALAALLLLPFSVMFLPAWHVKGVPQFFKPSPAAHPVATRPATLPSTLSSSLLAVQEGPLAASSRQTAPAVAAPLRRQFKSEPRIAADQKDQIATSASPSVATLTMNPPAASRSDEASASSASFRSIVSLNLPQALIALWIAGALFFLARWRMNAMRLGTLVRRAGVLTDSGWNAQVRALSADLGIDRHVALLVSDEIEVPITTGTMFPRIVLSLDYQDWSPMRRAAILNHELAHIKRLDAFTQALANVATSLYWFHPLVWLMARAMRAERERACDDHVLAAGTKASDYA
ncbi:MAG TPA: M56 family metallopeptidase, partial [Candidatus Angelobacter sp.]|nr:M56 family metallopeptidase [Candidatus Angelobacter sp.]